MADVVRRLCPATWAQRQPPAMIRSAPASLSDVDPVEGNSDASGCEVSLAIRCLSDVILGAFNGASTDVGALVNAMASGGLACTSVWRLVLLYALCCSDRMRHLRGLVLLPGELQDALANAAIIAEAQLGGYLKPSDLQPPAVAGTAGAPSPCWPATALESQQFLRTALRPASGAVPADPIATGGGAALDDRQVRSKSVGRLEETSLLSRKLGPGPLREPPPLDRSKSAGCLGGKGAHSLGIPSRPTAKLNSSGGGHAGSRCIGRASVR